MLVAYDSKIVVRNIYIQLTQIINGKTNNNKQILMTDFYVPQIDKYLTRCFWRLPTIISIEHKSNHVKFTSAHKILMHSNRSQRSKQFSAVITFIIKNIIKILQSHSETDAQTSYLSYNTLKCGFNGVFIKVEAPNLYVKVTIVFWFTSSLPLQDTDD